MQCSPSEPDQSEASDYVVPDDFLARAKDSLYAVNENSTSDVQILSPPFQLYNSRVDPGGESSLPATPGREAAAGPGGGRRRTTKSAGPLHEYVDVVVRLKPPQKRAPDACMPFVIEAGPLPTPRTSRTGRVAPGSSARSTAASVQSPAGTRPPRTSAAAADPTASPSVPSSPSPSAAGYSLLPAHTGSGASRVVLSITCPSKAGGTGSGPSLSLSGGSVPGGPGPEEQRSYEFGEVLGPTVTDDDMCQRLAPGILDQLAAGFNSCVLCYGQTGSGKTHTISALTPFLTRAVFDSLDRVNDVVEISYIQIYNNCAYDLLGKATEREEYGVPLPRPIGKAVCEPKVYARSAEAVRVKVAVAQRYRCTASHRLNARSSRSHTLLSLHVTRCVGGVPVLTTRVTLADLAGSERVKRTGVQGGDLTEAIAINRSLSVLHSLIIAAASDSDVLPYRESLLTRYLAPKLREWHIVLVVTASLERSNAAETKNTLDFATTAKRCVITKRRGRAADRPGPGAAMACDSEELCERLQLAVDALGQRVAELQTELAHRSSNSSGSGGSATEQPPRRVAELERLLETYQGLLHDRVEDIRVLGDQQQQQRRSSASGSSPAPAVPADDGSHASSLVASMALRESVRSRAQELLTELRAAVPALPPRPDDEDTAAASVSIVGDDGPPHEDGDLVDAIGDAFLWSHAQLDSVCAEYRVLGRAVDGLRGDNARLCAELQAARHALAAGEAALAAASSAAQSAAAAAERRHVEEEDRHAAHFLSLAGAVAQAEMAALYGIPQAARGAMGLVSPVALPLDGGGADGRGPPATATTGTGAAAALLASASDSPVAQSDRKDEVEQQAKILDNMASEIGRKESELRAMEELVEGFRTMLTNLWGVLTLDQKGQILSDESAALRIAGASAVASSRTSLSSSTRSGSGDRGRGGGSGGGGRSSSAGCNGANGTSGGGSLARMVSTVQQQARTQELEGELASMRSREADRARGCEEHQRTIAALNERVAKMAEQVVGFGAVNGGYLEALQRSEADRADLVAAIGEQHAAIADLRRGLAGAKRGSEDRRAEAQRLRAEREGLLSDIAMLRAANEDGREEWRRRECEQAARAQAAEDALHKKILRLEWQLQSGGGRAAQPAALAVTATTAQPLRLPSSAAPRAATAAGPPHPAPPPNGGAARHRGSGELTAPRRSGPDVGSGWNSSLKSKQAAGRTTTAKLLVSPGPGSPTVVNTKKASPKLKGK